MTSQKTPERHERASPDPLPLNRFHGVGRTCREESAGPRQEGGDPPSVKRDPDDDELFHVPSILFRQTGQTGQSPILLFHLRKSRLRGPLPRYNDKILTWGNIMAVQPLDLTDFPLDAVSFYGVSDSFGNRNAESGKGKVIIGGQKDDEMSTNFTAAALNPEIISP